MDRTTLRVMKILSSEEYRRASEKTGQLKEKVAASNRFQVDAALGEARSFFSALGNDSPEIYAVLAAREKEIYEQALLVRSGKRMVLD
ncbi:MAG: hypothetical protein AB1324_06980 [Candidatus Micrarchaeota archaeon]